MHKLKFIQSHHKLVAVSALTALKNCQQAESKYSKQKHTNLKQISNISDTRK